MSATIAAPDDVVLFASDMHLGDHDPATAALFLDALAHRARQASHLFLLGDLFETWVGDDQHDGQASMLVERLASLAAGGLRIFVMRGNRDFLLDAPFPPAHAAPVAPFTLRAHATMLEDPTTIALHGRRVLLAHGDALCTDDLEYQSARRNARGAAWQHDFLARPLGERLAVARELRDESRRVQAARAFGESDPLQANPGDVNALAVEDAMRGAAAHTLIHGHTHRPACHRWSLDGEPAERWVLPDWHAARSEDDTDRGGFLRMDASGWTALGI